MIHLTNITKQHGSQILFQNASLQILPGTRTGLVGPNGAGKTTIFRLITGEEEPDSGEISCAEENRHRLLLPGCGRHVRPLGPGGGDGRGRRGGAALGEEMREMEAAMGAAHGG